MKVRTVRALIAKVDDSDEEARKEGEGGER